MSDILNVDGFEPADDESLVIDPATTDCGPASIHLDASQDTADLLAEYFSDYPPVTFIGGVICRDVIFE